MNHVAEYTTITKHRYINRRITINRDPGCDDSIIEIENAHT